MENKDEVEELAGKIMAIKSEYWYANKDAKWSDEKKEEHRYISEKLLMLGYRKHPPSSGLLKLDEHRVEEAMNTSMTELGFLDYIHPAKFWLK